jgi:LysM repeat protein
MKPRQNWFTLAVFLFIIGLFLVACERPLPGGYNDTSAPPDTSVPDVPMDVPEVDSGSAYPSGEDSSADSTEAGPSDASQPEQEAPAEEGAVDQGLTADDQPAGEEPAAAEAEESAVEQPAGEAEAPPAEGAPEESAGEAEVPAAEGAPEESTGDAEVPTVEDAAPEATEIPGTHTVAAGENLYRIGLLYGINWVDLAEANGITDPTSLYVGQVLVLPGADSGTDGEAAEEAPQEVEQEAETVEETAAESDEPGTYTVQAGDTLNKIGALLGVDWTEIAALNGIIGTQIYAGQVLIIPVPSDETSETQAVESNGEETTYVVKEGDSIYSVAFEHNIPWTALVEANNIEAPYSLELGQTLIIPTGE